MRVTRRKALVLAEAMVPGPAVVSSVRHEQPMTEDEGLAMLATYEGLTRLWCDYYITNLRRHAAESLGVPAHLMGGRVPPPR